MGNKILKYAGIFLLVYIILSTMVALAFNALELNSSITFTCLVTLLAALFTGDYFLKDFDRLPSKKEKHRLIWISFLGPALLNMGGLFLFIMTNPQVIEAFKTMSSLKHVALGVGTFLLIYAPLYIGYGWALTKMHHFQQKKKGKLSS